MCCVSYRNQSIDLHCKSNDWFLYEMQLWAEMSWISISICSWKLLYLFALRISTHLSKTRQTQLSNKKQTTCFNLFQPRVVFHIETSHLFCRAKQLTGFYMKSNTRLKRVNLYPCKPQVTAEWKHSVTDFAYKFFQRF